MLKGVTETVWNEVKEQIGGFLSMLLGTLGASLLGNNLIERGISRAGKVEELWDPVMETKKVEKTSNWISNAASSLNQLWNTKILSKWA